MKLLKLKFTFIVLLMVNLFNYHTYAYAAEDILVRGKVTDVNGESLIGVEVHLVGTGTGTITDIDGNYELKASSNGKLKFSYVGYDSVEIPINGGKQINVSLKEKSTVLDEVVVVGYGTMKRKEMTSAISHVNAKELNHVSSLDASMLLQGKVSGVSVTNTALADPNSQGSIQIRGISSRNAGLGPLIVVDGVPGGNMTNINPADIESVDVLKDGAASAIYGTRGGNGVILVNLKKGTRDGVVHTSYSNSFTFNVAKRELDVLTAQQYRDYRTVSNPLSDLGSSTDWFKEATRVGFSQMHTITLSGGNSKTNYRVTADYRDSNGIDLRSDRQEYGARASITHNTKDGLLTFTTNITPRVINRNKSATTYMYTLINNPTAPVYDPNSADGYYQFPSGSSDSNIVETMKNEENGTEIKLLEWNAGAQINLTEFLKKSKHNMSLTSKITFSQQQVDKFNGWFLPSTISSNISSGVKGKASRDFDKSFSNNLDWVTNYMVQLNDHKIKAMVGYSYTYNQGSGLSAENWNFTSDGLKYNDLGSGDWASQEGQILMSSYKSDSKLIGFFGRVNYDWKERYIMSVSIRHEGSSRFGEDHKWGNFPAVSFGWRISDESFMKNIKWLNDLKFRYDYGVTGNQEIGNYNSLATYRAFGYYQYNNQTFHVWGPSKNTNTNLRWEKGHNQNIGVDFSVLDNRITGSLNYFIRKQSDLLGSYDVSVPPHLFTTIYTNVGTLKNTGFEFDITADLIRSKKLNWSMTLVGATNDNKFVSFSNDIYKGQNYYNTCTMSNPNNPGYLQRIEEGKRIGNYYTWRYAGVDKSGNWLIFDKDDNIKPISQGTEDDKCVTGNGLPKFTGSMTHNLTFGHFDLALSCRYALGFDIFNVHDFYFGLQSMTSNVLTSAYAKNAHITTGKNVITDYFIEPGDYFKLDNITVGYTLPINKKYLESIRLFGTASNLYTFTRFSGIDPSTYQVNGLTPGTFGGGYNYYPSAFQFIIGTQISF